MSKLHVAFKVGNADYVIAADDVLHLESFTGATRVPGAPEFVAGLGQVGGRRLPVVDVRPRVGLGAAARTIDNRIIVVKVGTRVAGLLVDSARDILRLDEGAFTPPPEMMGQQGDRFVKAVITIASRLLLLVDVPRVIGEEITHAQ